MSDPGFRAWIKWRHINVANFLNDVRIAAQSVDPDFAVVIENFPLDYFDGTAYGLDGTYIPVEDNFITVWETDSVSNTQAMKYSTPDDYENKLAMLKWGKAVHPDQPSWSFSYGFEPLDAALTMAGTVATQNVPFESKTPTMLSSVDFDFRTNWFGYVADHESELFTQRVPNAGIWYSSSTRDFHDYETSGKFGLYSVTAPPVPDDTWWAIAPSSSVVTAKHVGGYRGMSAAMIRMNIPYTVIHGRDEGPRGDASALDMLILPSVISLSDADADYIRDYVQNGGTLLATGELPGTLNETGVSRPQSAIADLFDFQGAVGPRVNRFGSGLAIYRPDIIGTTLFGEQLDANTAADTLSELEKLVHIHVDEPFTLEDGEDIYVDRAIASDNEHLLYLVNYSGLQIPLVQSVKNVVVHYKAPFGKQVSNVIASTPDSNGLNGFATVSSTRNGNYKIELPVDQFALLEIKLVDGPVFDIPEYAGPQFDDPLHAEAARSGLDFVLANMRNSSLAEPYRFGVHTNLLDNDLSTEVYTGGHHVTGEHMGLLLRTAACMGDRDAFDDAYRYASEVMYSPLYHLPNWSIDKNTQLPFQFYDAFNNNWYNANAPLDDLRLIHGLIDGYENFGRRDANELADSMLEGLYWTTVTDRSRNTNNALFPQYAGGLLGFAWDWAEIDDPGLSPVPAVATGTGYLGSDLLPVDYQDLGTIAHAAERDPQWRSVLQATTQLLLDSEINLSGLYYNGYKPDGSWTGDFEFQGSRRGEHLKVIQELWTAIHLARVSKITGDALSATQKALAGGSAARSLAFFKNFYQANSRIPEYLKFSGVDVDNCVNNQPADCLARGTESLFNGEARIYAQVARLALLLGDSQFAKRVIDEKIIADRVTNSADPRYGVIGVSTTGANDAEAWNILESVFSICLNAISDDDSGPIGNNNNPPVAALDSYSTPEETPLTISAAQLLANDTDPDNNSLSVSGLPSRSGNGGSVELLDSGDWRYTPEIGFSGLDTISYAISDGAGGSAVGQINIDVIVVPKTTHLTDSVTILSGALNFGQLEFLTTDDTDTYDVDSAATATGNVVDWYISGNIADRTEVSRMIVTYSGHYSVPNVTQETSLYNFATGSWVSFDTRIVGDESDSIVRMDITQNPREFIANDGETRVRVRGTQATQPAVVWANSVEWVAYRGNQGQTGPAPVAVSIAASTLVDTSTAIVLQGTGSGPLSYEVNNSGMTGSLTGTAPNLTYTPAAGFVGTDSFSYTVSDGQRISTLASVTVQVQPAGIISNLAAAMTLDGNLDEWSGFVPFADDPLDVTGANNPLDWRRAMMAHDGANFYIAYVNEGPVNVSWGQTIYFDIDNNPATGAQFGLPIGADRVLQGRFLYSYAGSGDDWNWTFMTEVSGTSSNGIFEYSIPRGMFDNTEIVNLAFVGSNEPYGGVVEDLYPDTVYDSSATGRHFTYASSVSTNTAPVASDLALNTPQNTSADVTLPASDVDGDALSYTIVTQPQQGTLTGVAPDLRYLPNAGYAGPDSFSFQVSDGGTSSRVATISITVQTVEQSQYPSNLVTQIAVDGSLADWQALRFFSDDPNDVSGAENPVDYLRAAMAHDSGYFYLTFTNDGQDLTVLQDWLFTVYIDADSNPSTGYQSGLAIGADYMQQGGAVNTYSGTGQDWTWAPLAATPRVASGSTVEIAIPRQVIGDPSELKFVLIGDNLSIGGGVEDVYPDGTYDSSAADRYLGYSTNGAPSEPVVLAAADSSIAPVSGRQDYVNNAVEPKRQHELEPPSLKVGGGAFGIVSLGLFGLWIAWRRRVRKPTMAV